MTGMAPIALAWTLAAVVAVRCVCVLHGMSPRTRTKHYATWLGFGLAYAVLCVAALGSAAHITEGTATAGDWLWLLASCGLIAFDRRDPMAVDWRTGAPSVGVVRQDGSIHQRQRQQQA